jgi:hypothetical protein
VIPPKLSELPDYIYPVVPYKFYKTNYEHITDKWVRSEFENIDRLVFEVDKALAQIKYLQRMK